MTQFCLCTIFFDHLFPPILRLFNLLYAFSTFFTPGPFSFSASMKSEQRGRLDDLQSDLFAVDIDSVLNSNPVLDSDSISTTSKHTAATSLQLWPRREQHKILDTTLVGGQSLYIRKGVQSLHILLDCLIDMAIQECAQIEQCLAETTEALSQSVGMNSYSIGKDGLFPLKR